MTAQQPPTDEAHNRDRLSGPAASVPSSGSPSLLWMLIAVVTTLLVLGVLASQCSPAPPTIAT